MSPAKNLNRKRLRFIRRWYFSVVIIALFGLLLTPWLIDRLGGAFRYEPESLNEGLSTGARTLLNNALSDLAAPRIDYHTHIVGVGDGASGASINESLTSWKHPLKYLKALVFISGSGISELKHADGQYFARLLRLIDHSGDRSVHYILGFDHHYNPDGTINHEKSEFYIPNEYVYQLSQYNPARLIPAVSIHPYRDDALPRLQYWAQKGVRLIKWLPNAQGIDASSPRLDDYYRMMLKHNMVLLTHVGEEQAVEAEEDQRYGNPLRFRRPLEMGVTVIMAHSASLGKNIDLDYQDGRLANSFDLFLRLMDEPRYRSNLYAELSAITQINRLPVPLKTLLARQDLHSRIVDGSDYPLPALNVVISTQALQRYGFISAEERQWLNEIYHYNPLLFDYVLKRTLRHPQTGQPFSAQIFSRRLMTSFVDQINARIF